MLWYFCGQKLFCFLKIVVVGTRWMLRIWREQTIETNKREEDNRAKQWGHESFEMDGKEHRLRQRVTEREEKGIGGDF